MQRSNWVTWCWFACNWDAASKVTWPSYSAAAAHCCSAPTGILGWMEANQSATVLLHQDFHNMDYINADNKGYCGTVWQQTCYNLDRWINTMMTSSISVLYIKHYKTTAVDITSLALKYGKSSRDSPPKVWELAPCKQHKQWYHKPQKSSKCVWPALNYHSLPREWLLQCIVYNYCDYCLQSGVVTGSGDW